MKNSAEGYYPERGQRPRLKTPSEIYRILHIILMKAEYNSCFILQNIFKFLKEKMSASFVCIPKITPGVLINLSIICRGLHFWRHQFNATKFFRIWSIAAGYGELCMWFSYGKIVLKLIQNFWLVLSSRDFASWIVYMEMVMSHVFLLLKASKIQRPHAI